TVQSDLMHLAVRQIDVDCEAGAGEPGRGDSVRPGGLLQPSHVRRRVRPGPQGLARQRDLRVTRPGCAVVRDAVTAAPKSCLPVPLRAGVQSYKLRGVRARGWRRRPGIYRQAELLSIISRGIRRLDSEGGCPRCGGQAADQTRRTQHESGWKPAAADAECLWRRSRAGYRLRI